MSGVAQAGRVYLFHDAQGLARYQAIDEVAIGLAGGAPVGSVKPQDHAWFGQSVATGDFNGDGREDLAVGMPGRIVGGQARAGSGMILQGDGTGLDLAVHAPLLQEVLGAVSEKPDSYGWALAVGDWNVDGYDDVAVGAPFETVGDEQGQSSAVHQAGAVYVHYGGPGLVNGQGLILRQGSGATPGMPQYEDWFGFSLASVHLENGNAAYLVIGIPGEVLGGVNVECSKAGAVQWARSWPALGPVTAATFLLHQDTGAPHNVADQRECSKAVNPTEVSFSDPPRRGEFFGWATGQ